MHHERIILLLCITIVNLWHTVEPETSIVGISIIKVEVFLKRHSKHRILGEVKTRQPFLMPFVLFLMTFI